MNNYRVSFYKNIKDTNSTVVVPIQKFLDAIKNGKYKSQITALRNADTKAKQKELKSLLPNITTSGVFKSRKDSDLLEHSTLKQIDIDFDLNKSMDPFATLLQLANDKYTFASFLSPTGSGVKIVVRIEPTQEKDVYKALEHYYKENFLLQIDTSCSNVSRSMFVSYDPDLFHNPQSELFIVPGELVDSKEKHKAGSPSNSKYREVELLVEKIERFKTDITGDYHQWIKIGFSLASEFGQDGEYFYHRISQASEKYERTVCSKQYYECCKNRKAGVGINTLFSIAKDHGILVYDKTKVSTDKLRKNEIVPKEKQELIIFYTPIYKTDDEGKQVVKDVKINYVKFTELLFSFGFRRFDIDKDFIYIQMRDNVIKEVTILQISDYFFNYLENCPEDLGNGVTKRILKEKMYNNPQNYFCDNRLSRLFTNYAINFNADTKTEAFVYFKNGFVRCNPDGWQLLPYSQLAGYIWENQIIGRAFKKIEIENLPIQQLSPYAQFLYNVCGKDMDRFNSLCSLIGYLLHSFTDVKMKAIILTDSRVSDEANGRTGKTLFGQTLKHIKKLTQINGKDFDPTQRYKYQEATLSTQIIFLNDVRSNFKFEVLYNDITEGITVEKKNQNPFNLKTKMCITTNKTIVIEGSSSKDRSVEFEFANHYSEKFSPEDEFKHRFFSDWDTDAWLQFDNFMMRCICVYLGNGIITPKNVNLGQRKLLDQTHSYFIEFMNEKIAAGEITAGKEICKQELHSTFLNEYEDLKTDKYRSRLETFTKWLKIFAKYSPNFSDEIKERKSNEKRFFMFLPQL